MALSSPPKRRGALTPIGLGVEPVCASVPEFCLRSTGGREKPV